MFAEKESAKMNARLENEDLIGVTEAMNIMKLSRTQVLLLCKTKRIDAKKVGNAWIITRKSAENYTPGPQGFAAVWERRKAEEAKLEDEVKAAVDGAKKGEGE